MGGSGHPYSPAELELPGFVPQRLSQGEIVAPFLAASLLVVLAVWIISGRCGGRLSRTDRSLMCWWAFTGLTHVVLAGSFLFFTPDFFSKENPSYFHELFKEYSKGDSRYAARDTVILALEVITIGFKGPASLLAICDCNQEILQLHPPVCRLLVPALRMFGLLHHCILGWLQLLGQSILLLGVFHRHKQSVGCHTNARRYKELEDDIRSIPS
ncbi:unnamed protein product [Urochloa decumbens]|uniref:EXPERA domain-containing protein n=1 Tax=Urochloa decumbens TaxID=240449 RepID=A0ABC8ZRR7_9POAL